MRKEKILVIEDNERHLADARAFLEERVKTGVTLEIDYVSTLSEAREMMAKVGYDVILTDIFFPATSQEARTAEGDSSLAAVGVDVVGSDSPYGVLIAEEAFKQSLPVVLVTSTHHHGRKTQPVHGWAMEKDIRLIDSYVDGAKCYNDLEAPQKNWAEAYLLLMYTKESMKELGERPVFSPRLDNLDDAEKTIYFRTLENYCTGVDKFEKYKEIPCYWEE